MRLYPAIDILDGSAVRLVKGDFDAKTVYERDPLAAARAWVQAGARFLHVVDLDGAKGGTPVNIEHLRRIAGLGVPVQYGGGLRSPEAVEQALAAGAERVILGTAALGDPELLDRALERHGQARIVVSVDVRDGEVSVEGWTRASGSDVGEVIATLIGQGVSELAYTNVDRDGMLGGVNFDDLIGVARGAQGGRLLYSGGIGELEDLRRLARLRSEAQIENLAGVIVGKALYEGRFTIADAHEALAG
ncbi:MAG TPA: 1-(5-phosphoribosyl)-5-[(5-phosphoribosylamino)methylideneamino]imidazole-4-carboxamide isomerase [Solirubrobacteraceae bacterium]|nr:1-(5-phosphoribosyl)-5-[(5-phosphoribosylamino)methylideneamino]imidazole-4-carboxamide isomerase [Solirubrobacteraceae bacterium]